MPEVFGHLPDGQIVERVHLHSEELRANVLTYGAIVQDLRLNGVSFPLVLGADSLAPYLEPMQYFGAMVGRYANRIAHGRFSLHGQTFSLSQNFRQRHCLHGGVKGSGDRLWTLAEQTADSVTLVLTLLDGEMGFPGTMDVILQISLTNTAIQFEISARCDQATVCNFAHHGYFILDDSGSLARHRLRIAAEHYLPVDNDLIPTGETASVAMTPFDFRRSRSLRNVSLDHNYCLSDRRMPLRPVAWLVSIATGVCMRIETTEPGLQVYTAGHLPRQGIEGLEGRRYACHAGIALEAQVWPDAPNRPYFPTALLLPGAQYHQCTRYVFDRPRPHSP
jgi:aldose 1-epimerase